jgi:hypothetical protein
METEAVFRAGRYSDFSGDFRPFPTRKKRSLVGRDRKMRKCSDPEYCFHEIIGIPRTDRFLAGSSELGYNLSRKNSKEKLKRKKFT